VEKKHLVSEPVDAEVIEQILKGDVDAFEILVERYQSHVTRIVLGKVPAGAAPEVIHEAFLRAFKSLAGFKGDRPLKNWLSTITVRSCYDYWRQQYKSKEVCESALSEQQKNWLQSRSSIPNQPLPTPEADRIEARQLLDWALGHLSAEDRMVLILTHLEGHTTAEAAEFLGWSKANVKVRCFRARKKLRKLIRESLTHGEVNQ
jgi:RNA polymerase sigma-70 factor (ECF subfamily)